MDKSWMFKQVFVEGVPNVKLHYHRMCEEDMRYMLDK